MACCGGKRRSYIHHSDSRPSASGGVSQAGYRSPIYRPAPPPVFYEYVGEKALTVIGSVSGRRYRFPSQGTVVAVDGYDSPAIAAVPGLRRVNR